MGRMDEEDRPYLILDKDTGAVYDMRRDDHVEFLSTGYTNICSIDRPNWSQWWKQKKQ